MEIVEVNGHIKCELGACRNKAAHAIRFDRVGIRGRLYVCDKCMRELYQTIGAVIVPKSVETAKAKRGRPSKAEREDRT